MTNQTKYMRRYRKLHREKCRAWHRKWRAKVKAWLREVRNVPCMDCGRRFPPECMDFDHVRGRKLFGVCVSRNISRARLEAEIKKCDIVCANCHRKRTYKRRNR